MLLLAAAALGIAPAAVHGACMSLGGSTMCPHFQTSYIDPEELASDAPGASNWGLDWKWMNSVTDANTFDQQFKNYLTGTGGTSNSFRGQVQDSLNCWKGSGGSSWGSSPFPAENQTGPTFPYQTTALCSIMVGQPSSFDCAEQMQGNANTQQPACSDVCDNFAQSLMNIADSKYWCGSGTRAQQADKWKEWCNLASEKSDAQCVEGSVNEIDNCGFGEWTTGLCEYCQGSGSGDSCCSAQSVASVCPGVTGTSTSGANPSSSKTAGAGSSKSGGSKGLSGGAIAGIVVGVVCGVLILAAILGFLCWRRKKKSAKSQSLAAAPYEKFGGSEAQNAQSSPSVSPASMHDSAPLTGSESHTGRNAALGAAAGAGAGAAAMAAHNRSSPENARSTSPVATRNVAAPTAAPTAAAATPVAATTAPMTSQAPTTAANVGRSGPGMGAPTAAGNVGHGGPGVGAPVMAAAAAVPAAAAGAAAGSASRPLPTSPPRQATSPPPRPTTSSPISPASPTSPVSGSAGRSLPSPPGAGAALGAGALGAGAGAAAASPFASPPKPTSPPPSDARNKFYNVNTSAPSGPAPGQYSSSTPVGAVHASGGHNATPVPAAGVAGMAGVGAGALAAARQSQPPSAATTPNGSTVALPSAPTAALAQAPAPSEAVASNANRQAQILDATGAYITPGSMVTVMHPYAAQMPDELTLAPGMRLKVADLFDDGWGTAVEVAPNGSQGRRGQFPTVCVQASS